MAAQDEVFRDCEACPEMVVVPPGRFIVGSPTTEEGRDASEGPRREVTIQHSLAVGVYEVTFEEWDACVVEGGCGHRPHDRGWGRGRLPVFNVSRDDTQEYLGWLSEKTGMQYRLLSESEWEYVARAGTETARYWGESESEQCRYANGSDNTLRRAAPGHLAAPPAACSDGFALMAPVGSFEPNEFGLHDVLGNVWEWTEGGLRGGSWSDGPEILRSAHRITDRAEHGHYYGFRVARTMTID